MKGFGVILFLVLGFALVFGTAMESDALSAAHVQRAAAGSVMADANGIFKLVGFTGTLNQIGNDVNVSRNYVSVGSITNNTTLPLTLTVTITPDFSGIAAGDKLCELGITVDTQPAVLFMKATSAPKSITLSVPSGKVLDVKASLLKNKKVIIPTTYGFTAYDANGQLVLSMTNTTATPRQMNFK